MNKKNTYYGEFGGQYVSESLMNTLEELDEAFEAAIKDPEFIDQYNYYLSDVRHHYIMQNVSAKNTVQKSI